MKQLTALLAAVLLVAATGSLPAVTSFMPVSEVRPGMVGVGRTVFSGDRRDEFTVQILGVLRNVLGPRRDLIIARLAGGPLAETGVLEGMSGSPVYVNGRLIGAVSYSLGAFPKEPIAGITPIAEMMEATARPAPRAESTRPRIELPVTPERLTAALRAMYERVRPLPDGPGAIDAIGLSRAEAGALGLRLAPIASPLVMSGFSSETTALLRGAFGAAGFAPMEGRLPDDARKQTTADLQPGDAVGVSLVRGDYELGATGTVTHVDGGRVYAFGHPFFNLGPTQFPMTRAQIYSLLPSLMTSSKIAAIGDVIGTVEQDRATAIAGTLGDVPRMIPVSLTLDSGEGDRRTLSFQLVHDEFFTPLLSFVTVTSTLTSFERQIGSATFTVSGAVRLAGHPPVRYSDLLSGPDAVSAAATYITGPVALLMANPLEPVRIEGLDLTIDAAEAPRTATIERAWLDEVRPRAGQTLSLKVALRAYGGEEKVHTVAIPLPSASADSFTILVSDSTQLAQWEQRELRRTEPQQTVDQIVRTLNEARKHNRIYVRLVTAAPGAVVSGEPMPALPPSIVSVLEAQRAGDQVVPIRSAVLGAWEIETGYAISGSRQLTFKVEPAR